MRGREWDYVDMPGLKEINGIRKFRFYSKYARKTLKVSSLKSDML